jgi:hypothetical protein
MRPAGFHCDTPEGKTALLVAKAPPPRREGSLLANINTKLNAGFSLFGFYVLNHAMSNTDGIGTFPANPYNSKGEYGPAATDVRHRFTIGGSINFKWYVRVSPFVVVQGGDITTGNDLYGTTLFNSRPGIATDANKPGLIKTRYGLLDPNPTSGEPVLSRNFGRGPEPISANLRVAKTIGFGAEREESKPEPRPNAGGGGLVPAAGSGGGLRGVIGNPSTPRRYNLTLSMSIRNLLNHTNPGPITGNITSPLFGQANQVFGSQNGEGFHETANNRRLDADPLLVLNHREEWLQNRDHSLGRDRECCELPPRGCPAWNSRAVA